MTSRPTAMRRLACASGAGARWKVLTLRRSRHGSTGRSRTRRPRCRKPRSSFSFPQREKAKILQFHSVTGAVMAPRVLISDALSPAAVQIFRDRGVEVDFQPKLGSDKEKLAGLIGTFDGLAIRSATKVTPKILERAKNLKVIGRAGIGVDNVDIPAATQ